MVTSKGTPTKYTFLLEISQTIDKLCLVCVALNAVLLVACIYFPLNAFYKQKTFSKYATLFNAAIDK